MIINRSESISLVPIESIKPRPDNRNKHSEEQIERLCKIIQYQGFRDPLIISNQSGLLVSGHGRLMAAQKLGMTHIPVVYQDFESEAQEYAAMVSENSIASWAELDLSGINADLGDLGPDFDLDLLGIENFKIDVAEHSDADSAPENIPFVSKSKLGDVWTLGNHRLMCGDSTQIDQIEKLMNGEKADLWITDPPYGVDYVNKNAAIHGGIVHNNQGKEIQSDTKSLEELCPFWRDVATSAYAVSTDKCANYWFACQGSDKMMMMMMMMMMQEAGWNTRHELIWVKSSLVLSRADYHYRHEPIIYGWKKNGTHEWFGDRKQDSVLEFDRPTKSDLHPTTKPVELISRLIQNSSDIGYRVLDTFGGSGTTLIACELLRRKAFLMEIDPRYVDTIITRWQKQTGLEAVRDDGVTFNSIPSQN